MFFFIYIILVFLILRFSVTLFNFLSNPKLGKYGKHFPDKVTIVISAETTKVRLQELLRSLELQEHRPIEVLINCANKENEEICQQFCAHDERFRMMDQNEADYQNQAEYHSPGRAALRTAITGDFLLFLDADTRIRPGFLDSALYRMKVFHLSLLNIIPTQQINTIKQRLLLPVHDFVLLNLFPLRLVRLLNSPAFSASGDKCMLFLTSDFMKYRWYPGREAVRQVKEENLKAETLLGDQLISISFPSDHNIFDQSSENLLLVFGDNTIAALVYLILLIAGPLLMLGGAEYELLIMPVGLIFLTRIMISFLVRQNPLINVLLHPVQMIALCFSLSNAIFKRILTILRQ